MPDSQSRKPEAPSPDEVPPDMLSPLSRRFLNWKNGMVLIIAILLSFTFLNVIVTNPTVVGMSVHDAGTQDTERFSNMSSVLIVVFAFFALFLFIVTRKLARERSDEFKRNKNE
jgi:uncharacterized BrkB/YihY/UPF0761 family membrane protein